MIKLHIQQHRRFFLAVEGQDEVSFFTWLQKAANKQRKFLHLDCHNLRGGGYQSMVDTAIQLHKKKKQQYGRYVGAFLIVDADRATHVLNELTIPDLRTKAKKTGLTLCLQDPNLEGVLRPLKKKIQTPFTASALEKCLTWEDALRLAKHDAEYQKLFQAFGLL
ncbi:MAG: hypothetical protein ACK59C_08230 [Holosporales bacterium]|jgi:hypothetical protein